MRRFIRAESLRRFGSGMLRGWLALAALLCEVWTERSGCGLYGGRAVVVLVPCPQPLGASILNRARNSAGRGAQTPNTLALEIYGSLQENKRLLVNLFFAIKLTHKWTAEKTEDRESLRRSKKTAWSSMGSSISKCRKRHQADEALTQNGISKVSGDGTDEKTGSGEEGQVNNAYRDTAQTSAPPGMRSWIWQCEIIRRVSLIPTGGTAFAAENKCQTATTLS